jgi:hypothetical protein
MVVPNASLAVLPNPWFQRRGFFHSYLYPYVLLGVFVDAWTRTDIKKDGGFFRQEIIAEVYYFLNQ